MDLVERKNNNKGVLNLKLSLLKNDIKKQNTIYSNKIRFDKSEYDILFFKGNYI